LAWVTSRRTSVVDMASGLKEDQATDRAFVRNLRDRFTEQSFRKHVVLQYWLRVVKGTLPQEGPSTHNKRNSGMDHIRSCKTSDHPFHQ
jgi:hypothetical protein